MSNGATAELPNTGVTPNENTNVSSEPIEIAGGDQTVSFDDLESVKTDREYPADKPEKTDKPEKAADDKSKDPIEEKDKKDKEIKEVKDKVASKKANDRLYKVKLGDKDVDLSASGKIEINVGGKTQEVSVQDLINGYHGSQEIHRRMTQIGLEKKAYETNKRALENTFNKINELYKSDKPLELLNYIIEEAGLDPSVYTLELYEKLAQPIEEWNGLSQEEKQYRKLQIENEALKRSHQKAQEKFTSDETRREIEVKVQKIQQDYGLTNEKFFSLYQELIQKGFDENKITPETIAQYADEKAVTNYVHEKIVSIAPNYEGIDELTNEIVKELSTNHALEIDDIESIIKAITTEAVDEQIEEKLKSSQKKKQSAPSNPNSDPTSWDELT